MGSKTEIDGPFEGFHKDLRLIATVPENMRPYNSRYINCNDSGGIMICPDGTIWWIP